MGGSSKPIESPLDPPLPPHTWAGCLVEPYMLFSIITDQLMLTCSRHAILGVFLTYMWEKFIFSLSVNFYYYWLFMMKQSELLSRRKIWQYGRPKLHDPPSIDLKLLLFLVNIDVRFFLVVTGIKHSLVSFGTFTNTHTCHARRRYILTVFYTLVVDERTPTQLRCQGTRA